MHGRSGLNKILVIGSGPIQIGQGCEFDYSGTQACRALRDLGYEVVLVNSNPATIMTDPDSADRVYIEPLTYPFLRQLLEQERPQALLPTMGGQVALNLFLDLHHAGDLQRLGVKALGVSAETVEIAEDRRRFRDLVTRLGLGVVRGGMVRTREAALRLAETLRFPLILRASFTLGGMGGGIARNRAELIELMDQALAASQAGEVAVEESIINWKEYELEVMRDRAGNFVVVCGIENVNPMGVHTGDSITVAPPMTLTDRESQNLRDMAKRIFEAIGMETGGANIQFAVHPDTGEVVVIEMNPRVSRSSALVSKATGYPIARLSAKLAVGCMLDELTNEITKTGPAAFEPAIDYVAVKIPRWDFAKFPGSSRRLSISMKSVGEVLAFGSNFKEAFQKAWRSLELGYDGWPDLAETGHADIGPEDLRKLLEIPTPDLFPAIKTALKRGWLLREVWESAKIGMWFLYQLEELVAAEEKAEGADLDGHELHRMLRMGFSRSRIARLTGMTRTALDSRIAASGIAPTFKMVDSCAGEFAAQTPYYFKTWEHEDDNRITDRPKVVILGSGPNRVGQGIEFDYSCVHAVHAAQAMGYEAILVNCNPETVSTDYQVADKLYIEPLTIEDVLDILAAEKPRGVLIQFGGQTPLKLAGALERQGYVLSGCPFAAVELCEDRAQFGAILDELKIAAPAYGLAVDSGQALAVAERLGFPLLLRPSYVIGGQGMKVVRDRTSLLQYIDTATQVSPEHPVLIDRYLAGAEEFDIDLLCDGVDTFVPAVLQHIEEAGIHSGDSACLVPPVDVPQPVLDEMIAISRRLALRLGVRGAINLQFALWDGVPYVLEVNPRSSRTLPFVAKATGLPLARYAAEICLGRHLAEMALPTDPLTLDFFAAKAPVFPFKKFPGTPPYPGPEMKSLGEAMGRSRDWREALAKAYLGAGHKFEPGGPVLILGLDGFDEGIAAILERFKDRGVTLVAVPEAARRVAELISETLSGDDWRQQVHQRLLAGEFALAIDLIGMGNAIERRVKSGIAGLAEIAVAMGIPLVTTPRALATQCALGDAKPQNPELSALSQSCPGTALKARIAN